MCVPTDTLVAQTKIKCKSLRYRRVKATQTFKKTVSGTCYVAVSNELDTDRDSLSGPPVSPYIHAAYELHVCLMADKLTGQ